MIDRKAHAWGAAIVAAGALLGGAAALWAGRPGALWRPLAIGLAGYLASGLLVLRWGLEVYGWRGGLGSVALAAFTPCTLAALAAPAVVAPAGGATMLGSFAQLAAVYALMRCLLDPNLQWALLAGVAMAVVPVGAFLHGSSTAPMTGLATLSLALVGCRTMTAGRYEPRARVARASAVAVGLAWAVALAVVLVAAAASHLPSLGEYTQAHRRAPSVMRAAAIEPLDPQADSGAPAALAPWPVALPLAALLLTAVRPWRRQRRYSDAGWGAALLCLGIPLWLAWGEPGGVFMAPIAALLAGACWDMSRPRWARRAASAVVGLQAIAALLLWPRYPGGVRPDAWLPNPDVAWTAPAEAP